MMKVLIIFSFERLCFLFAQQSDPVMVEIRSSTEEGKKVTRNHGNKWDAVFRRVGDVTPNTVDISCASQLTESTESRTDS